MRLRRAALFSAVMLLVAVGNLTPVAAQEPDPPTLAEELDEQVVAAEAVLDQLAANAGDGLTLEEIDAIDELGPPPWLSMAPGRSAEAVEAWKAVAEQLPERSQVPRGKKKPGGGTLDFAESEAVGEVGVNDTIATGETIRRFGTDSRDRQQVTITGSLSGGVVRPPIQGDCESTEDDGAIGSANPTPAAELQVALCVGEIGDGPFADTSGDLDFYSFGTVEEGTILIVDVWHLSGSLDPVESVIGIYDAAGNLLGSVEDPGDVNAPSDPFLEVIAPATGEYFAAVAGCCDLSSDPFDSSSGPGVGETGTYEVFVVAFPPPCVSSEDDGAIGLANETLVADQGFDICSGELGDGPHGSADTDWYTIGPVDQDLVIGVGVFAYDLPLDTVVGLYQADGTLVASSEFVGDGSDMFLQYAPEGPGDYYVAIAGGAELQGDPFDPATGVPSGEAGLYDIIMEVYPAPCTSVEDDGAIGTANATLTGAQSFDYCLGAIGDGPHGQADTDWYSLGTLPPDHDLIVDVATFEGPVRTVVGIYDAAGNLVASAEDSGDPEGSDYLEFTIGTGGEYFVAVAGCCQLQSNPTDPASGAVSTETGTYEVVFAVQVPPCESTEDDGSIGLANDASGVVGSPELYEADCFGSVGDGPQAALNGDVDFFRTRPLPAGRLLIVDIADLFGESGGAGALTIGIYDQAGNLIASGSDDPADSGPSSEYFSVEVPADGSYLVAIGGGLPTDPFDETTGTDSSIVSGYSLMYVVDTTTEYIGELAARSTPIAPPGVAPGATGWAGTAARPDLAQIWSQARSAPAVVRPSDGHQRPLAGLAARLEQERAEAEAEAAAAPAQDPAVDTDVFLVHLDKGDVISGGFDELRSVAIIDPAGVQRSGAEFNPSFIYPVDSALRHDRRNGFDHVATVDGRYAVVVTDGVGDYEGELRVTRAGLAEQRSTAEQIVFLDFDGADVAGDVFGTGIDATLSPLSAFLEGWGLTPADEDAVIDSVIDSVIENVDADLRVRDGRNGDRDASGKGTQFDVEILNSRDNGDRWGDPDVTRVIIGGTIDELQIPTLGIAQSIDPGNLETEETSVVLLDEMSAPAGSDVSINSYPIAAGVSKTDFIGFVVGHIASHEMGHLLGNWHQETFNGVEALMDAGGDFPAIAGVGNDGVFGTADDADPDFIEDVFNSNEGFSGIEDTAGRSVFALSTGSKRVPVPPRHERPEKPEKPGKPGKPKPPKVSPR